MSDVTSSTGGGRFTRAKKVTHPVDEVLPPQKLLVYGAQHVLAFYAGAVIVPILLAGGRGLGLKHGQHLDYNHPNGHKYTLSYEEWKGLCGRPKDGKARLSNVMLTMIQAMDVKTEKFADSLGPVSEILA